MRVHIWMMAWMAGTEAFGAGATAVPAAKPEPAAAAAPATPATSATPAAAAPAAPATPATPATLATPAAAAAAPSKALPKPAAADPATLSKKSGDAPPLDKWVSEVKSKPVSFPHVIAFVSALPAKGKGEPKFLPLDPATFNKLSYFQIPNLASVEWDYKLNKAAFADLDPLAVVLQLTKADTVVLAPEKGAWKFLRAGEDGKREVLLTGKPPKSSSPEDIAAWIPATLGWDGVVLEQRGDFLLVGATARALPSQQIQALAVSDSADKFSLKANERKGAGLLSLSETKDGIGVFDIVFLGQGVKQLPPGTKLLIEKKK